MQRGLFFNNGGITLINFKKSFLTVALGVSIVVTGCSAIQVSETDYRKDAIILDKESEFFSQPDKFKRKHLLFTANVSNVTKYRNDVEILFEPNGLGGNTPIAVHYKMKDDDNILVKGEVVRILGSNDYNVHFKGSIKDDGTGTYECYDEYDRPLEINGTIKMPDSKTVEIDTPQVQYRFSAYRQMGYSEERINAYGGEKIKTMPAGHYVYKIN